MAFQPSQLDASQLNGYARAEFHRIYGERIPDTSDLIYREIESTGSAEVYTLMDTLGDVREWIGDRQWTELSKLTYTVTNKKYEFTLAVEREAIEDDKSGQLNDTIQRNAILFSSWKARTAAACLASGFNTGTYGACIDGKAYFANDHPCFNGDTLDNLITGNLDEAELEGAVERLADMPTYRDDNVKWGHLPGEANMLLIVPVGLYFTARSLLKETKDAGGGNELFGQCDLAVNPYLTTKATKANSAWYLMVRPTAPTAGGMTPVIYQRRVPYELRDFDEHILDQKDIYVWPGRARGRFGYGLPQMCVGSAGT